VSKPPSTQPPPLHWDDDTVVLGIGVRAHFFDPHEADMRPDLVSRRLPVFAVARPRFVGAEGERPVFAAGDLWAQPDAVFEHGGGLLCLTYRQTSRLHFDVERWKEQLKADALLKAVADAMAVGGARQVPTAALVRMSNALLLLAPSPQVLECLASSVGAAKRHWKAPQAVSATQLATFCEPLLRSMPGVRAPAPESVSSLPTSAD
jgi:hypothetical protein